MTALLGHFNYVVMVLALCAGLFLMLTTGNLIKRMIGLALTQSSAGLFYISLGKVMGGTAAIRIDADSAAARALAQPLSPDYVARHGVDGVVYSNPLPHVLILTAIVVGVATLAVGLALVVRIREAYGAIESDEIDRQDRGETA